MSLGGERGGGSKGPIKGGGEAGRQGSIEGGGHGRQQDVRV